MKQSFEVFHVADGDDSILPGWYYLLENGPAPEGPYDTKHAAIARAEGWV